MASLANAKKGEIVLLKSGKRVTSDGRGGGRVVRKPQPKKKRVVPNAKPTKNKPKPKLKPASGNPVARGLRGLAGRGDRLEELTRQTKGK